MKNAIGETVVLNGKEYKITGTHKRSFILEKDGKQYKATQDKINKILEQNSKPQPEKDTRSFLERRIARSKIFRTSARMPENEEEAMEMFLTLSCELSPENLSCDGEASRAHINAKLKEIHGAWKELEDLIGKTVLEDDVWRWERERRDRPN